MNSAEDVIYAVFTSGSFFGEFALLFSQRRTATIKANTYCDLFTLSQEDLHSVLNDFPEFEVLIKKEGLRSVVTKFKVYPYLVGKDVTDVTPTGGVSPLISGVTAEKNTPMLDLVVSKLRPRMVMSGNAIFRAGVTTGEDGALFFISKGTVILEDELGNEEIFTVVEGQHFGHYSAQRHDRRSLTARAKSECQLFFLSLGDFDSVVSQFPEFLDVLNLESPSGEMEYFD